MLRLLVAIAVFITTPALAQTTWFQGTADNGNYIAGVCPVDDPKTGDFVCIGLLCEPGEPMHISLEVSGGFITQEVIDIGLDVDGWQSAAITLGGSNDGEAYYAYGPLFRSAHGELLVRLQRGSNGMLTIYHDTEGALRQSFGLRRSSAAIDFVANRCYLPDVELPPLVPDAIAPAPATPKSAAPAQTGLTPIDPPSATPAPTVPAPTEPAPSASVPSASVPDLTMMGVIPVDDPLVDVFAVIDSTCESYDLSDTFLSPRDLDNDGIQDVVVNYAGVTCNGEAGFFCAIGGCRGAVYQGLEDRRFRKLWDDQMLEVDITDGVMTLRLPNRFCSPDPDFQGDCRKAWVIGSSLLIEVFD